MPTDVGTYRIRSAARGPHWIAWVAEGPTDLAGAVCRTRRSGPGRRQSEAPRRGPSNTPPEAAVPSRSSREVLFGVVTRDLAFHLQKISEA